MVFANGHARFSKWSFAWLFPMTTNNTGSPMESFHGSSCQWKIRWPIKSLDYLYCKWNIENLHFCCSVTRISRHIGWFIHNSGDHFLESALSSYWSNPEAPYTRFIAITWPIFGESKFLPPGSVYSLWCINTQILLPVAWRHEKESHRSFCYHPLLSFSPKKSER